jgi:hypothetical protein
MYSIPAMMAFDRYVFIPCLLVCLWVPVQCN